MFGLNFPYPNRLLNIYIKFHILFVFNSAEILSLHQSLLQLFYAYVFPLIIYYRQTDISETYTRPYGIIRRTYMSTNS